MEFLFPFCNHFMLQKLFNAAQYSQAYMELLKLQGEPDNLFCSVQLYQYGRYVCFSSDSLLVSKISTPN